ncbi:MAG TPA: aldo/keto reductase [Anaeromyxobacter sp.]|nr:aldo/keto reductase [Anaeromyxobacter sp.]
MATEMQLRNLGKSGIQASVVGLGTFAMGGWFWGGTDEKKAIEAIHASIDLGINLIDTAPIYGFGMAETIVGKAIKGKRDKVVLATKAGLRWNTEKGEFFTHADDKSPRSDPGKYKVYKYLGPDSLVFEVEESLRRLGTDVIDLYQTHWQEATTPIETTMEALLKLKQQGKIRAIGVSNVTVDQLKRYGQVASAQEKFSLLDRDIVGRGLVDYCIDHQIAILSYFSMEQGLLTGAMDPLRRFKDGDTRKGNPLFGAERIAKVNGILGDLKPYATKYGATLSQLVIALTARQRGITHVLVGARDAAQAKENARGGMLRIADADVRAMEPIAAKLGQIR